jgi:hypothetical protein
VKRKNIWNVVPSHFSSAYSGLNGSEIGRPLCLDALAVKRYVCITLAFLMILSSIQRRFLIICYHHKNLPTISHKLETSSYTSIYN